MARDKFILPSTKNHSFQRSRSLLNAENERKIRLSVPIVSLYCLIVVQQIIQLVYFLTCTFFEEYAKFFAIVDEYFCVQLKYLEKISSGEN